MLKLLFAAALLVSTTAFATQLICNQAGQCVYESDGTPWKYTLEQEQSVVAVGDIHGHVEILGKIYEDYDLLDQDGLWSSQHFLIQVGDLVDRGPHSKLTMDFAKTQETSSLSTRGRNLFLLGNHDIDLLKGITWGLSDEDIANFRSQFPEHALLNNHDLLETIFTSPTPYSRWIASRNAIVQINDTFFTHAYLPQALSDFDPGQINSTIRRWLRFRIGLEPQPEPRTEWVFGPDGPFNNTMMTAPQYRDHLPAIFQKFGVNRVVMGHVRKPHAHANGILLDSYSPQVIVIDTGMGIGGVISSLLLNTRGVIPIKHPDASCSLLLERQNDLN